jgi:serine/threonine protein kinase
MIVYDSTNRRITLGREVGHGGEAAVYRVQGQANLLAKIYVPPIHPHYEPKVAWMKDHPPEEPDYSAAVDEHDALAWPIDLLYDRKGQFAGYLMPRIRGGVTLLKAFNPRERAKNLPFNHKYLHRTARNLAAAVASLHAKGYVVGDLHESNAIVTPQALVTMIDTDSFQVQAEVNEEAVCYRCVVGKPEYTAPELQGKRLADVTREPEQDCFALAVLIFQLLMEGNHPFRSRWGRAGEPPPLEVKIARGLFPHVKPPPDPVTVPPNVPSLDTLHPGLSALMQRCFVDGHKDPHLRPTAVEWRDRLEEAEAALVQCCKGHYYSNLLVKCPQCEADERVAKRKAAARRQQGINFSPWLQQAKTAQSKQQGPVTLRVHPANIPRGQRKQTKAAPLKQFWTQASPRTRTSMVRGMMSLVFVVLCLFFTFASALLECPGPTRMAPTATRINLTSTPDMPPTNTSIPWPTTRISPENAGQLQALVRLSHHSRQAAWSPDGKHLTIGLEDQICIYDIPTLQRTCVEHDRPSCVSFSPDGTEIASGTYRGTVEMWKVSDWRKTLTLSVENWLVRDVAYSPDGAFIASGMEDGSITLWETSSGNELFTLAEHDDAVVRVIFSPDGQRLVSGSLDGTVKVWRVSDGRHVRTLDLGRMHYIALSPDGTHLAAAISNYYVTILRVSDGQELQRLHMGEERSVWSVAFSPDGKLLASGLGNGTVRIWEVSSELEFGAFSSSNSTDPIFHLTFSPDGRLLAVVDIYEDTVTLWGVPSGLISPAPIATPDATPAMISGVVIDASTHLSISGASVTTDPPTNSVTTDVEGRFAIPDVPPGSYTVTVTKPGYAIDSVHVSVRVNGTAADVALLAFPQPSAMPTSPSMFPGATSGVISGVVFDMTTGLPMPGVDVTTDPPTVLVTTDAEGRFTIPAVSPGSYIVEATKHGLTIGKEVTVVAGKETVVNFGMLDVSGSSAPSMPSAPGAP